MRARKIISGGQAIVMVSLALFAMAGMMGLAVDLGWSFFVQKQAQSTADGAALAAVQEAYQQWGGGLGTLTCVASKSDCKPITNCGSIGSSSSLYIGCQYAQSNGFTTGGQGGHQNVTVQSDVAPNLPTTPSSQSLGISDIKYWVTVRAVQTIPQLFSSMLGNTQGTVAAVATAAIAGSIAPGSFYGMNWKGDCLTGEGSTSKAPFNCGVDINLTSSSGSTACTKMDGTSSGVVAKLCAPAGIFLSSECDGSSQAGCGSGNSNNAGSNYAGQTGNNPDVWAESGTHIKGNGWVDRPANWLPANTLSNHSTTNTGDPTRPLPQPPVLNPSQPTCAVKDGDIKNNQTLGPFQYYHVNSNNVATGLPIAIGNNMSVTFSPSSTFCPGASSGTPSTGTFKTFTFWGGMDINGNANTTVNFGAGQYVMAGTNSTTGTVFSMGAGGNTNGGSVTGESGAKGGTQFLFTDGTYSSQGTSLAPPPALTSAGVNLYQGFTDIKNIDINLNGLTGNAPTLLTDYKGIMFWQDRRNSTVHLNPNNGDFIDRVRPATTTDTSPQMVFEDGNANVNLKGVMYQGRGAWLYLKAGGAGVGANVTLETITGALNCGNGCGSATFTLKGPGAPLTVYVTSLIQ